MGILDYFRINKRISRLEKKYNELELRLSTVEKIIKTYAPDIWLKTKLLEYLEESVINAGMDTFGDLNKFKSWLEVPCFALGNKVPLDLLKSKEGRDIVINQLGRIKHGTIA